MGCQALPAGRFPHASPDSSDRVGRCLEGGQSSRFPGRPVVLSCGASTQPSPVYCAWVNLLYEPVTFGDAQWAAERKLDGLTRGRHA